MNTAAGNTFALFTATYGDIHLR